MTEIALFANTNEKDLEQMVSSLEVPGLTHLVLQELGWQAGGVYSPQWDAMTPDERGKTDHNFRKRHVDHYNRPKKLTTAEGKNPIILQVYSPTTIPLPTGEDETCEELKQCIESVVATEAERIRSSKYDPGKVNAYHVGEVRLEYRIPDRVARGNIACMSLFGAGAIFLSQPSDQLLQPRWTFNLTYFNIEE